MKKLLELITGEDNITLDPQHMWAAIAFLVGLGLQIYSTVEGKAFDLQGFGIGAGALLAGLGLGKKLGGE